MEAEGYPHALPSDSTLAEAARALEDARLTGEVVDAEWRLRYVSSELRNLVGIDDDERLGYGRPALTRATDLPDIWRLDEDSRLQWWQREGPFMRHDVGADSATAAELGPLQEFFEQFSPHRPPIAWAGSFVTTFADASPATVGRLVVRLVRPDGEFAGILGLYVGGGLRGSVQAMLSRGDDRMFERMAALTEPARRPAAILFCDLEDSGVHSRKLSSYRLLRDDPRPDDGDRRSRHRRWRDRRQARRGRRLGVLPRRAVRREAGAARGAIEAARRIQGTWPPPQRRVRRRPGQRRRPLGSDARVGRSSPAAGSR